MLRVSKLTDYATILLAEMARKPDALRAATELAEATRLELPTVSKVLKLLGSAALVQSQRGVAGGYRLARPAQEISVAQIVEAIDGPIGMTRCSASAGECSHESHCTARVSWQHISRAIERVLADMTLADMLGGLPPAPPPAPALRTANGGRIDIRLG
ncbi:SUF system Fe-S cluster assembly regulator [Pseudofulvimonas gallinarii]|jgi:FeS assembly SUF system regulator|uniref:BadM/Rrf2 family transcriptional regulator n=1 Tax=Pseudofulvimonas gallinarii TaxID=634155 RepID=A0A4V2UWT2_9GAMM|nr:SUF system Fe-S cluster assembly regulator [Pseudofulvimonas gallinarii]TCT00848.1 BadM/Rrf2 family transcriptional regulator [Pseudofulvimonas gallinarii]THD12875.1 SUF system Fe-S cluster assembly regulator [Pseudofulvimonas gallinarii]